MKKKKVISDDYGRNLSREEMNRIADEILASTKPEDLFPEAYKRFVEHIDMLEREGLIETDPDDPTPDPHQTPPSPS
jgi:hypothetical protein